MIKLFLTEQTERLKFERAENRTIFCSVSQTECSDFGHSLYPQISTYQFIINQEKLQATHKYSKGGKKMSEI